MSCELVAQEFDGRMTGGPSCYACISNSDTASDSQNQRRLVKSSVENLFILKPSGIYTGRVKIEGKVMNKSLEASSFEVAKKRLKVWRDEVRGKPTNDATLGSVAEEYGRRLQLEVTSGDIKPRTRNTKLECLTQAQKVWQEIFDMGKINPAHYGQGGDHSKRVHANYPLFVNQRISQLSPAKLDQ